jgi:hypothetical protein
MNSKKDRQKQTEEQKEKSLDPFWDLPEIGSGSSLWDMSNDPESLELIFNKTTLTNLHRECNGVYFEAMDYQTFESCFQLVPSCEPEYKVGKQTEFCGVLAKIEEKRDKLLVPSFEKWLNNIGITGYCNKKSRTKKYKKKHL